MLAVEQSPARARLVEHSEPRKWSSAQTHLKGGASTSFHGAKLLLDKGLPNAALIGQILDAPSAMKPSSNGFRNNRRPNSPKSRQNAVMGLNLEIAAA
jgi:hypothetical protein